MASLNKITLMGHIGRKPEFRVTQEGRDIATFSLATTEKWTDKKTGEKKEKTEWHNIVIFSPHLVKLIKDHADKGSFLYLEGALRYRKWKDQQGNDRYASDIVLDGIKCEIKLLPSGASYVRSNASQSIPEAQGEIIEDEIPF